MSVECRRSTYFADTLESFLRRSYIKRGRGARGRAPVRRGGAFVGESRFCPARMLYSPSRDADFLICFFSQIAINLLLLDVLHFVCALS